MAEKSEYKRPHKYRGLQDMFCVRYCDVCGKDFVVLDAGSYVYQKYYNNKHYYFCGYNCSRKWQREKGLIK